MSPELPREAVTPCVGYSQVSPSGVGKECGGVGGREGGEGAPYSRQTLTSSGAKLELRQFSAARAKSRKVLPILLEECINKKIRGKTGANFNLF